MKHIGFLKTTVNKIMGNKFEDIAYTYYPKNIYEFDDAFRSSEESKRLNSKINDNKIIKYFDRLFDKIEEEVRPNQTDRFLIGSDNLSYLIQIVVDEEKYEVISIYFSFLIPYYHILFLKGDLKKRKIVPKYSSKIYDQLLLKIKSIINRESNYAEFPRKLILDDIPLILVKEKFTYLNAFFTDYYRIKNF